jgi:HKD family nuclease
MIVEFLGQGLYDEEIETSGNHICSALNNDFFNEITFFVAFLRKTGLSQILKFLKKAKAENKNITFFVGIDQKVTSKQALEKLLELNIPCYIYNTENYIYHPKIYLFEGKDKNRIIIGSSNFTNNGLFNNVEASVLLDFTSQDKSGMKVLNQLKNYFNPLLEYTEPNLYNVTQEYIDELYEKGLLSNEDFEGENVNHNLNKVYDKTKKLRKPSSVELGNIDIKENRPLIDYKKQELKITDTYLEKWEYLFQKMKAYKEKYNSVTVAKEYEDRTLYGWYQKQKLLYNHSTIEMPKEHIDKLLGIDFYFGDGHILRQETIKKSWLEILKEAVDNGEDIKANHRYIYKEYTLGTWLTGVASQNRKGKKLEVKMEIENLGFDFSKTGRNTKDVFSRLIGALSKENPDKKDWRTRIYKHVLKQDRFTEEMKKEIEEYWELQFSEKLVWGKMHEKYIDKTDEWKLHRKKQGQWYPIKSENGEFHYLHSWTKRRFKSTRSWKEIIHKFNETELEELRKCGFPV